MLCIFQGRGTESVLYFQFNLFKRNAVKEVAKTAPSIHLLMAGLCISCDRPQVASPREDRGAMERQDAVSHCTLPPWETSV